MPRPRNILRSVAASARSAHDRDRRFERDGVLLSTIEAARGLSFRAVAVAGMAEKIFPADLREDPLLLDQDRERFAITSPRLARLPMKRDRFEEERLLFHLATTCSRERLLLTWSRLSEDEEHECLPSPFLREAAGRFGISFAERDDDSSGPAAQPGLGSATHRERAQNLILRIKFRPLKDPRRPDVSGALAKLGTIGWMLPRAFRWRTVFRTCRSLRRSPIGRSTRPNGSWRAPARDGRCCPAQRQGGAFGAHARALAWRLERLGARRGGGTGGLAAAQISSRYPFLMRALTCERARHSVRSFGPYDGFLSGDAARKAFAMFLSGPVSSTRIDEYAACPFKAFLGRVLKIRALRDPVETISIEPLARGILVHRIVAEFLGGVCRKGSGGGARLSSWPPGDPCARRLHDSARTDSRGPSSGSPWDIRCSG